jgi:hypothetical protein
LDEWEAGEALGVEDGLPVEDDALQVFLLLRLVVVQPDPLSQEIPHSGVALLAFPEQVAAALVFPTAEGHSEGLVLAPLLLQPQLQSLEGLLVLLLGRGELGRQRRPIAQTPASALLFINTGFLRFPALL